MEKEKIIEEPRYKLTVKGRADLICQHFFDCGATIGKKDFNYVVKSLEQSCSLQKQEIMEEIEIRDAYKLPFSDNEIEQYLMDNERHWRMQANIWYQKGRDDENQELKQTLNK